MRVACFLFLVNVEHNTNQRLFTLAHEAAVHTARLRVEISQSRSEQQEYLKNVELARVLDKRAERKRQAGKDPALKRPESKKRSAEEIAGEQERKPKSRKMEKAPRTKDGPSGHSDKQLQGVLGSIF